MDRHLKFKHPFTCLISGPTGSGKTELLRDILYDHKILFDNITTPLKVLWYFGAYQELFKKPIKNVIVTYINKTPSDDEINSNDLIIFDDLMSELSNDKEMEKWFTKKSHHLNKSIIFTVQNLFLKTIRTVSLNSHYLILMNNPRDTSQITHLAYQLDRLNPKRIIEAYEDATSKPYGYLVIDLKVDTPKEVRLRSKITSKENQYKFIEMIIYKPKRKNV